MTADVVPAARPRRRRTALGSGFRRTWSASVISAAGTGVHFASFPLLAAQITHSPGELSLVTAVGSLPWLLLALPAGAVVDRGDPRHVMVVSDVGRAVVLLLLTAALAEHRLGLPALVTASGLLGAGEVFFDCASLAFLPRLVAAADLESANGRLYSGMQAGQNFVGQLVGGGLFRLSRTLPFLLNALSFVTSAVLLHGVRGTEPARRERLPGGFGQQIVHGVRICLANRPFVALTLISALMNAIYLGELALLVLFSTRVLHLPIAFYGTQLTALAVGALLGGMLTPRLRDRFGRLRLLAVAPMVVGATSVALGLSSTWYPAIAAFLVMGSASMVWNVVAVSLRQTLMPADLIGRANSVYRLVSWGAMPLGSVCFGLAAAAWGLRAPFIAGGALLVLATLPAVPIFRSLRALPDTGPHERQAVT
ncbi:MFS transporter [Streptomyces sp. NPDC049040]|uniref:MFS transporter n=1 Tax=Streptomyces sp. NPDC049040 TaxID=3365593 RepID=UPI003712C2EF